MSTDRDFDRIARAWLDLMPDEAPDRTIAAVLQAIETAPQVRRPWRWLPWRLSNMNRTLIAAAVAGALVLAVGGGLWLTRSNGPSVGGPTPTPASTASPSGASPSASPRAELVPAELRYPWLGEVVEVPGLSSTRDRSILQFGPSTVVLNASAPQFLLSDVASADGSVLELVSTNETGDCSPGDVGLYSWSLSANGSLLQLTATEDACEARRAAFAGAWQRSACRNPDNLCLGDLGAGTYKSQFIGPRLDEGEPWTANFGAFSYTVPAGWANTYDFPDGYVLMRSADYATATEAVDGTKDLVEIYARPGAAVQNATCDPEVKAGMGRSVAELVSHVTQHPELTAGAPQPITIDGHAGQMIDVEIAPSSTAQCPVVGGPFVIVFNEVGRDVTNSGTDQWALWKTSRARIILLDLGGGDVVLITLKTLDPTRFGQLLTDAMPIVESLTFK